MTRRQRIWLVWGLVLSLVPATALAAPTRVDRGFGAGGIARTTLPPSFVVQPFDEVAATGDGGVTVAAGFYGNVEVRHYGADGSLLGTETRKEVELQQPEAAALGGTGEKLPFSVEAAAKLTSGKVLAAGAGVYSLGDTKSPPVNQVFVARFGTDGKLDPSFGKGGIVKLHSEDEVTDQTALHVQGRAGDGAEVVTGSAEVALDGSGNLDQGFGDGGRVPTLGQVVGAGTAAGEALLVAGTKPVESALPLKAEEQPREVPYVARYTAAGKPDPAYAGGSGIAVLDPGGETHAGSALVEPDGSVVVGAFSASNPTGCPLGYLCDGAPILVRFTPDGRLDPGFGVGGVARLTALASPFGTGYFEGVEALAARPGGGVFAAGGTPQAAFVAAIGPDGSPDGGFGSGGIVSFGATRTAYSAPVAIARDGSGDILVAAQTDSGPNNYGGNAVLRYSGAGGLDRGFGEGGAAFVPQGVRGLAVAPDGSSFVISGESGPRSSLTELTPAGAIDPGFGAGGSVILPFASYRFLPEAIARPANGDLLVAGNLGPNLTSRPAVLRYLPDGRLDPTFGKDGVEVVKLGQGRYWLAQTMTVDRSGRILLAGSAPRRHQRGCCTRAGVLIRLRPDGRLDPTFGRGGGVLIGNGSFTAIESLALRGNRIIAAGTFTRFVGFATAAAGDLLFSIRPDGRLDRTFGDQGVSRVLLSPNRKSYSHGGEETVSVFSTPRRILLVRSGFYGPLLSFSPSGRPQPNIPRAIKGLLPRRQKEDVPVGPSATLDGSSLILAWSGTPPKPEGHSLGTEVDLQRLLLH